MTTFHLPDLGEGLNESEIVAWKVSEGDAVALNDVIAEVETAKAVVDLTSPYAGVIRRLYAGEGETIDVGAPLVEYDVEGAEGAEPEPEEGPSEGSDAAPEQESAVPEGPDVALGPDHAVPEVSGDAAGGEPDAAPGRSGEPAGDDGRVSVLVGSVKADRGSRPARRARTFPQDPFVRESGRPASSAPASRRERVSGLRRRTAEAMVSSAFTAPHAACFLQVDVTETMRLAGDLSASPREDGPSFLALVSRAIVIAAGRTPGVNATFHAEEQEIEFHAHVDLGIAVATDRGLVVASVDEAERLDAVELTHRIAERAAAARDGSISAEALTSSTLTVSNVGVFGVDGGIPILNPGESAIVAIGAVRRMPWEHGGEVALRDVCTLTVSFDHRVLDGREASGFLRDIGGMLTRPGLALARG
ncbi:dihydrolipoamide acetyltransferase family protein [Microbacterium karelineae]|uniref:dihydrolipoamide acetyltransferase family protein n=1 Tax=Microbacterium karelineae TaxID=2654283 RepID=UPI0012EA01DB|nr:dihydrolipoamide acetyltransferase family protein [Microbacterium karelineae]